ncbi:unnamed protein product [Meganyctiphanes norvegica]|uniref:Uncharacterized protein n=1 Tax=Meganyctiphanes norvegica TaxID=48144 RepID=A0AAV2S747_MEGNR
MAAVAMKVLLFAAFAIASSYAEEVVAEGKSVAESQRTIFLDGGSTDAIGIVDVFLYIGTFVLATVTALAILGLIYGAGGEEATATGYAEPAATSYAAYEQAYEVARSLYDGYQKYEEKRSLDVGSSL